MCSKKSRFHLLLRKHSWCVTNARINLHRKYVYQLFHAYKMKVEAKYTSIGMVLIKGNNDSWGIMAVKFAKTVVVFWTITSSYKRFGSTVRRIRFLQIVSSPFRNTFREWRSLYYRLTNECACFNPYEWICKFFTN